MILADCTTPVHGLGNRITILCSAYAAATVRGLPCAMVWRPTYACDARWTDLFQPHPFVPEVDSVTATRPSRRHKACCYSPGKRAAHRRIAGPARYTPAYWAAWRECARAIRLREDLALDGLPEGYPAVHVRASIAPLPPGWLASIRPRQAFLSCDHATTARALREAWPDSWSLAEPAGDADMDGRDPAGMRAAARDMMALTKATVLHAVGPPSTFRNLAAIGYEVPVWKLYEGPAP